MMFDSMKKSKSTTSTKTVMLVVAVVLVVCIGVAGTLMFLVDKTSEVTNTFEPANVKCQVEESFDTKVKKNVNVKNTSNIDAYIRVKLVTYRVNDKGEKIGGTATIPNFTLGVGWFEKDGFYYYNKPVAQDAKPATDLIGDSGITLVKYNDADGGRQVVEVIAEAIQSVPTSVVAEKWKVKVDTDGVTIKGN